MWNHHCVFSLSRSPKILSQWRAYASDGAGVALGLDKTYLKHAGLSLVDCRYEDQDSYASELIQRHSRFLKSVHDASVRNHRENDFMDWVRDQRSEFYRLIEDLIALKNPAFSEECEVRAVWCRQMGEMKFRSARELVIPYVEANICPDSEMFENEEMRRHYLRMVIPEIWLGPKCSDLNRMSFFTLTEGMGTIDRHDCGYV
jgi:hypothetical protein